MLGYHDVGVEDMRGWPPYARLRECRLEGYFKAHLGLSSGFEARIAFLSSVLSPFVFLFTYTQPTPLS